MKFAHISDIHIRPTKYHNQYFEIFNELYNKLRQSKPDYIVLTGDIFHNKISISNECIIVVTDFLKSLSDISKVIIILGNHDFLVKSVNRTDSITPIVKALDNPNIKFLKNTGQVCLKNNFSINVYSILNPEDWDKILINNDKINIGLYHGPVDGCLVDSGWTLESEIKKEVFYGNDYVFAGDIHVSNQAFCSSHVERIEVSKSDAQKFLNKGAVVDVELKDTVSLLIKAPEARWAGSCIQQNFGEYYKKGFLLWDIEDKNKFTCKFIPLKNPNLFVSIVLNEDGTIPDDVTVPPRSRIRLVTGNNLSYEAVKKAQAQARLMYLPESVVVYNAFNKSNTSRVLGINGYQEENLRDIKVQEKLLEEYFKSFNIKPDVLNKIFEINKEYKTILENDLEDVNRNVYWKLNTLRWSNLYNYGENNKIDFSKLKGIVGLIGNSFSGKTSAIENMLYTIFNTSSKNVRKNCDIINQNKKSSNGEVEFEIDNKKYLIQRTSEKYDKKVDGILQEEAKTAVKFSYIGENNEIVDLGGGDRAQTDINIRKVLGTVDDFLLTNMSSQFGFLSFINEGTTKRKEIIAKFLDLEIFEKKCKMAREKSSELKAIIKKLDNKDHEEELSCITQQHEENEAKISRITDELKKLNDKCEIKNKIYDDLKNKVSFKTGNIKHVDKKEITVLLERTNKNIEKTVSAIVSDKNASLQKKAEHDSLQSFLSDGADIEKLKKDYEIAKQLQQQIKDIDVEIKNKQKILVMLQKDCQLLKSVPCDNAFPKCPFIKDAHESKKKCKISEGEIQNLLLGKWEKENQLKGFNLEEITKKIEKYNSFSSQKSKLDIEIKYLNVDIERKENFLCKCNEEKRGLESQIQEYEKNKTIIDEITLLKEEIEKTKEEIGAFKEAIAIRESSLKELFKKNGFYEQKINEINEKKAELDKYIAEFSIYEMLQSAYHSNGISYEIIKKKLPLINEEISKILNDVVDFEVYLEASGKKLDVMIKHPRYEARPLELGSGAEKTMAAIAIRVALLKFGTLPKCSVLIFDEVGVGFDETVMDGFIKLLSKLKYEFETIVIISHLEMLKQCIDVEINIDKIDGFAHIDI